ncbi:MAG: hypothetical protein M3Z41_03940 [Candidatus Eremiobacteraeota bacterium]|nr:hypothetical protein [Candidatus Eremiobacteraeota bacterium]
MRSARSFFLALFVIAASWAGVLTPTHAAVGPGPFPSPTPSAGSASPPPSSTPGQGEFSNPFPSPSPTVLPPAANGYVAAGYMGGSATGGQIAPLPNATTTPSAFPASGISGFWIDLLGRIAPSYLASLTYENLKVHGADNNPLVSYGQGRILYQPRPASRFALGLGLVSIQRSTSNANMNGLGFGLSYLPAFSGGVTPYSSLFIYPRIQTGGVGATFTSFDAGLMYVPKGRGGFFVRGGGALRSGLPASTSPSSVTVMQLGLGSSF